SLPKESFMVSEINPYAPPIAESEFQGDASDASQLFRATRSQRWWAAFIDGMLYTPLFGVGMFVASSFGINVLTNRATWTLVIWGCLAPLALYQWALIARTGQSLGKRWTRIKIFKKDGSDVDFVSGVVMRNWILFFIPSLFTLVVPEVPIANLVGFVAA